MRVIRHSVACDRVRSQVSLELDGELSQLERAMVGAHVLRCAECRAFRAEAWAFTRLLREAPLDRLSLAVRVARRPRVVFARYQAGVAAAMAFAVVGIAGQLGQAASSEQASIGAVLSFPTQAELEHELELIEGPSGEAAGSHAVTAK